MKKLHWTDSEFDISCFFLLHSLPFSELSLVGLALDLAVRCSTGSVELSCVAIDTSPTQLNSTSLWTPLKVHTALELQTSRYYHYYRSSWLEFRHGVRTVTRQPTRPKGSQMMQHQHHHRHHQIISLLNTASPPGLQRPLVWLWRWSLTRDVRKTEILFLFGF